MEIYNGTPAVEAPNREAWRQWLTQNHEQENAVWLIIDHKESGVDSVYYDAAVEEALCFGWIDSKPNKRDTGSYYLFFAKRKAKSNWSKVNKKRVEKLIKQGLMAAPGLQMIELAKQTGTWDALNDVENLVMPADLQDLFNKHPQALENYQNFPPSTQRSILEWILNAKKPETRTKRITETVQLASENIRANQYQKKK